jgi:hypothetical protein
LASLLVIAASAGDLLAQITVPGLKFEFGVIDGATLTPVTELSLAADSPGQEMAILVSNTTGSAIGVTGGTFEVFVGDGHSGPAITGLNFTTAPGTLFLNAPATSYSIVGGDPLTPQYLLFSVLYSATVPQGESLLGVMTLSTENVTSPGNWSLHFTDAFFNTSGGPDPITGSFAATTLTVVPEPQLYATVAGLGLMAFALKRHLGLKRRP